MIKSVTIEGYKSIRSLKNFELKNLNILVGANGAGKSNFIEVFRLLMAMSHEAFQKFILLNGGANAFPFDGPKVTPEIKIGLEYSVQQTTPAFCHDFRFFMTPTAAEEMTLSEERRYMGGSWQSYGAASLESRLVKEKRECMGNLGGEGAGHCVHDILSQWMVYHFHDTSLYAPMRRSEIVEDYRKLRGDGSNIAPFLLHLKRENPQDYERIRNAIQVVIPFFDDFTLDTVHQGEAEKVKLTWMQKGTDYPLQPYHFSDGAIRFICLATALLQPKPPSFIIIDEPELGLHPEAIRLLASLLESTSVTSQLVVATQSPLLLDQFAVEDVVVVRRQDGASSFERLKEQDYIHWFDDYTIGELWTKNVIQGGTVYE